MSERLRLGLDEKVEELSTWVAGSVGQVIWIDCSSKQPRGKRSEEAVRGIVNREESRGNADPFARSGSRALI